MSYKSEVTEKKDPIKQLEVSKSSIKDFFSDFLNETKCFKYQITLKVMLKKYKPNGEIEFRLVYINSTTKSVINHKFSLKNAFQEILYRIDNWVNEWSGWIVEFIESQYINISAYRLLSGSSYIKLPIESRNSKKGLINIKNNDRKCFLWCPVRNINPVKIHPKRITRGKIKKLLNSLNYDGIKFPVREKGFSKIEKKNNICINLFCYENKLNFPIFVSDQKFENLMVLLLGTDEIKSHYVYLKDFNRFIFHKTKNKNKKYFRKSCFQCFSCNNVLTKHKVGCLTINGCTICKIRKRNNWT